MASHLQRKGAVGVIHAGVVVIGEDLLDLIQDLVFFRDNGGVSQGPGCHDSDLAAICCVVGGCRVAADAGDGFALELDYDAANLLGAVKLNDYLAADFV